MIANVFECHPAESQEYSTDTCRRTCARTMSGQQSEPAPKSLMRGCASMESPARRGEQSTSDARSFVFNEIGNLITGLFDVLVQCREAVKLHKAPSCAAMESFELRLVSMRDVLNAINEGSQLTTTGSAPFACEVCEADGTSGGADIGGSGGVVGPTAAAAQLFSPDDATPRRASVLQVPTLHKSGLARSSACSLEPHSPSMAPLSPSWDPHSPSWQPCSTSQSGPTGRPIPTDSTRIYTRRRSIAWPLPTLSLTPSDQGAVVDALRDAPPPGELLVVDASQLGRRTMSRILAGRGVAHVCAADGAEALELVTRSPPDRFWCVLMAREMPIMGGVDATRAIHTVRSSLLVMGLTADPSEFGYNIKFHDAGAHSVLAKPFTSDHLVTINAAYSSREANANEP